MCLGVPPASVYKGAKGEGGRRPGGGRRRSPTPTGSRTPPPNPSWTRIPRGGKREGGLAISPSPNRTRGRGEARSPGGQPFHLSTKAHEGPYGSRGVPVTSRYSGKISISPGTLPMSKHRLPIYQSLCLDHFETPRHVCDHIRDSEQPSVHQNI